MNIIELLAHSPILTQDPISIAINLITFLGFVIIAASVFMDFKEYYWQETKVLKSDRSWIETGSMSLFFIAYYLSIKLRVLEIGVKGNSRSIMILVGLLLIIIGTVFNVIGRIYLKSNWANQIKIYSDHELIKTGPYSIVRHPLYASLIWIFLGGSLVYSNLLSLILNLAIFVPMMYFRAKKEDNLLLSHFKKEYTKYKNKTGMFFPIFTR